MAISIDQINEAYRAFKTKYNGSKQDYFAPLFLSEKFTVSIESVISKCSFVKSSLGIDAYFIDKETRILYLYLFKWSDNHDLLKEPYRNLISNGIEVIFGDKEFESNLLVSRLKRELKENVNSIRKVYISFVFNGEPEKAESSRVLESLREELESKKYYIDTFFNNNEITLTIQYISNASRKYNQITTTRKTFFYNIPFRAQTEKHTENGEQLYIGFIHLWDIYQMFLDMKHRLFEKNIRSGLSDELPPNVAIKKSLRDISMNSKNPDYFTFHHNGVTLYAENIELNDNIITIVEPRILNGAQTVTTFAKFVEDNSKSTLYNQKALEKIQVIGKIITKCSQEFVTQITISNNKQNQVHAWNLRANDTIQLEFDDKFRKSGIYYERQENAFSNLATGEYEEMGILQEKDLKIKRLAQTFLSIQGEIDKISDMGKVFENDVLYERTFRTTYLEADTRKIILCYKSQFRIGAMIKEIISKGESKYFFIRGARNMMWALIIQALLNDEKLDSLLETFGGSLTVEANFNEHLKDIASRRLRFILSELIELPKFQPSIQEEKFTFLKTKNTFQEAMAIAKKLYGWEMKTII
jgi:hypothetical protein